MTNRRRTLDRKRPIASAPLAFKAYHRLTHAAWLTLGKYKNRNTANTIRGMVERGTGLQGFSNYPPGTFEARIADDNRTVHIRRAQ